MAPSLNRQFINGSYSTVYRDSSFINGPTLHRQFMNGSYSTVYRDSSFINGFYSTKAIHVPYLPLFSFSIQRRFYFLNLHILLATTSSFVYFVHSEDTFPFPPVYDPTCSTFLSLTKLKIRIFSQVVSSEKKGQFSRYTNFCPESIEKKKRPSQTLGSRE